MKTLKIIPWALVLILCGPFFTSAIAQSAGLKSVEVSALNANSNASQEQTILSYVNQYRSTRNLKPLKMNALLFQEAQRHSQDMAKHRVPFGHEHFAARVKRLYSKIPVSRGAAENVAYNYKDLQVLVQGWIKSPGHQKNMVGNYNLTGIGIARDEHGKTYYTQIFLRSNA